MSSTDPRRKWIIIIAVVLTLHVALFLSIQPSFFSAFKRSISSSDRGGGGQPLPAGTIITIPLEIEEDLPDTSPPTESTAEPRQARTTRDREEALPSPQASVTPVPDEGFRGEAPMKLEDIVGESPITLPNNIGPDAVVIPPRPIEITWPDTRKLNHCLGHNIEVRIKVDRSGRILDVAADDASHPVDCLRAALESARRIVFEPGQRDGHPATMWTRIRIEFRKKR